MKKSLIAVVILLMCARVLSQNISASEYEDIAFYYNRADYYEAIKKMDVFLTRHPDNGEMYYNRGLCYMLLNDPPAAEADFVLARKYNFKENKQFLDWWCTKAYRVNMLSQSYLDHFTLKEENGFKPVFGLKDSLRGALRPERNCYDVYFYNLMVKILPEKKSIAGSNDIYFTTTLATKEIQIDLAENLKIVSISHKGKKLKFKRKYDAVFVYFDLELPANEKDMIHVVYKGVPREAPNPPWNAGFVWKKNNGDWLIGVSCEQLGASAWWPCKDHLSDKPDSMEINIQVPTGYQAIANGNLRSTKEVGDNYTNYEWFVSYPINNYGVTCYMGKFTDITEVYTNDNGSYNMDFYVLPQNLETAKSYYKQTKDIVAVYEKLYGEYPYKRDGVGMVEAPYSGMENQSAIAIGSIYTRPQHPIEKIKDYDFLLVHETAHEWWGNTVTMGDMADVWMSEGFATYSEHLFVEAKYGYDEYIRIVSKNMTEIENLWPMVGARDVNDNTFLGGDVYYKGAAMLHNLRCEVNNDSLFFSILKGFFTTYKFKIVKSQDFVDYVNATTEKDHTDFFNKFMYDKEPPVLQYSFNIENNKLKFTYQWINVGKNFSMPFGIILNKRTSVRLEGTTEPQTYTAPLVFSMYNPNDNRFEENIFERNSYTYFWTKWMRN